jgi:PAT family beta-lactamase induction signal transducer AmpG
MDPKILVFVFLGLSCGLPTGLIGASLILWMTEAKVSLGVIGVFSLIYIPYSLKFLWAPFVDNVKIPGLAKDIGQKKAWGLVFQIGFVLSLFALAFCGPNTGVGLFGFSFSDPEESKWFAQIPWVTFILATLIAFFGASQDIVVDALRIDTLEREEQGEGAAAYQFGSRLGWFISGAGVIFTSAYLSWQTAYLIAGSFVFLGIFALLYVKEPRRAERRRDIPVFKSFVVDPFLDFMKKKQWAMIFLFIILYKLCNLVLGRMAYPFYFDVGFTKEQIALVSGTFGPWITIAGVALGGIVVLRYSVLKCLFYLGVLEILTSVAFAVFAMAGDSMPLFFLVIVFDNVIGGMGGTVFVAFLSALCSRAYSATQYALLSSVMTLSGYLISSYSGVLAKNMGWEVFFLFTGALMIPALIVLFYLIKVAPDALSKPSKTTKSSG